MPPFVFNLLFIPSFHILGSSYFYVSLSYGGISHCFNFDKFCDTAPLKSFTFKLKQKLSLTFVTLESLTAMPGVCAGFGVNVTIGVASGLSWS